MHSTLRKTSSDHSHKTMERTSFDPERG